MSTGKGMIGVVGAGAMGAGIAQVAAVRGHRVLLGDAQPSAIGRAQAGHVRAMDREVERGRLMRAEADAALERLTYIDGVSADQLARVRELVDGWGKTTVVAADTPGFIVNRIARPFYGESLRIHEEGIAEPATIDWAMRELGGFRMGPFELMDFIGLDVNFAVSSSVFAAMFYDARYRPALSQQRLVEAGLLGRKAERGFYDYREGATKPEPRDDETLGQAILDRVLAMLINEAVDAVQMRVASPDDIELAMTKGVNYPKGLLAWGDEIGAGAILATLEALQEEYGEDRYRPSPLLRRVARTGGKLLQ